MLHGSTKIVDLGMSLLLQVMIVQFLVNVCEKFTLLGILHEVIMILSFSNTAFGKEFANCFFG